MPQIQFPIFSAFQKYKDNTALIASHQKLSFHELDRWSEALSNQIHHETQSTEQCIGILAPSSLEYAAALCAVFKKGMIAVPLQPLHPIAELKYIIENSNLNLLLVHQDCLDQAKELTRDTKIQLLIIERAEPTHTALTYLRPDEGQAALMLYTSGTTSRPKGVIITFGNLEFQMRTLCKEWGWQSTDRAINTLPLHHLHGVLNLLLCSLASGACCELYPKFDAQQIWERFSSGEITVFMSVPTIYSKLAQHWDQQPPAVQKKWSEQAARLRLMVSGSAALPLPLFEKWKTITTHSLLERYGMTEIGMAISNPYQGDRRPKSVGKPLPGVEVRLVADEIQIKGPNVFREYWKRPDVTESSFTLDGWFMTGDQARVDSDGYYYILGRTSQDIIKSGGYKISALEIESVLLERDDLLEVAILGIPDQEWGEKVAAVCVWKDQKAKIHHESTQYLEVKEWLKTRIAHYKVPTRWNSQNELPKNAMGKVIKPNLRHFF